MPNRAHTVLLSALFSAALVSACGGGESAPATEPITPSPQTDIPTTNVTAVQTVLVESAALSGNVVISQAHPNYNGAGYASNFWNVGDAVGFQVTLTQAGDYDVSLRFLNGRTGSRTLSLYVNGRRAVQTSLPPQADWNTWGYKAERLNLNAGTNRIEYKMDVNDSGDVNINQIQVTTANASAAPIVTTPAPVVTKPAPTPSPVPAPLPGAGNSVVADDCSFAAVQAAAAKASAGNTIQIPAGDCAWGSNKLAINAGIYIKGAGKTATVIRRSAAVGETQSLIEVNCANGQQAHISDLKMIGLGSTSADEMGIRLIKGCQDFKIHDMDMSKFTFAAILVSQQGSSLKQRGAIYNNQLHDNYTDGRGNLGYGVEIWGSPATTITEFGSANAVFIEDNVFSGNRHNVSANQHSAYVFRYNTSTGLPLTRDWGQIDAHGKVPNFERGTIWWEVYKNNIQGVGYAAYMRGGEGLFWGNTIAAGMRVGLATETGCTGTYPVFDQPKAYFWDNPGLTFDWYPASCTEYFQIGRDYWLTPKADYTPYVYPHPLR